MEFTTSSNTGWGDTSSSMGGGNSGTGWNSTTSSNTGWGNTSSNMGGGNSGTGWNSTTSSNTAGWGNTSTSSFSGSGFNVRSVRALRVGLCKKVKTIDFLSLQHSLCCQTYSNTTLFHILLTCDKKKSNMNRARTQVQSSNNSSSAVMKNIRLAMINLYTKVDPSKIRKLDATLLKYQSKLNEYVTRIMQKYGNRMDVQPQLQQLSSAIRSMSGGTPPTTNMMGSSSNMMSSW